MTGSVEQLRRRLSSMRALWTAANIDHAYGTEEWAWQEIGRLEKELASPPLSAEER